VHGVHDEVIPIEVSRRFAREHSATLVEVDDGHSLSESLPKLIAIVRGFENPAAGSFHANLDSDGLDG